MKPPHDPKPLTRRDFLRRSAVGLAAPLLLDLSCGQKALTLPGDTGDSGAYPELAFPELASPDTRDSATASDPGPHDPGQTQDPGSPDTAKDPGATDPGPVVVASGDVLFGLFGKAEAATAEEAFRKALSHLDFSWLVPGDTVFVKLSCNSGNPHPAVTSPAAVRAMVAELYARGAGKVIAGDQAGVENVRLAKGDLRYSSTKERMEANGLYSAIVQSGAQPWFFDDQGFDEGYFTAKIGFAGQSWKRPMRIASVIKDADHIVYLPRLSSHGIAGYTHGLKCAIGWLRDDSRYHFHVDAQTLYEKYVEVNYVDEIRDRFRMVATLAESVLLDFGPDEGTVAVADPRIVIASRSLARHDAVSSGVGVYLDQVIPKSYSGLSYSGGTADGFNHALVSVLVEGGTGIPWDPGDDVPYSTLIASPFEKGVLADRALARAFDLEGGWPESVQCRTFGKPMDPALKAFLQQHGQNRIWYV